MAAATGPVDYVADKVQQGFDKAVDRQADKIQEQADKAGEWVKDKFKRVLFFFVQIFLIIVIGWILSFLTFDRETRFMVKVLTVLCVINTVVQKMTG